MEHKVNVEVATGRQSSRLLQQRMSGQAARLDSSSWLLARDRASQLRAQIPCRSGGPQVQRDACGEKFANPESHEHHAVHPAGYVNAAGTSGSLPGELPAS